jgi:ferredoxin
LQHALPQGYFRWDGRDLGTLLKLRELVGEFEKPKFFVYKQKLCAHSRNETVGCNACVDICSAEAISSDKSRQQIKVNPNLCVGCGACTTVCPTGALTYAYPARQRAGREAQDAAEHLRRRGRQGRGVAAAQPGARPGAGRGTGPRGAAQGGAGRAGACDPVALWHTASLGVDLWLSAIAFGASQVVVLVTSEEAPQYLDGLQAQMAVAQAILNGLGYTGTHLKLLRARSPTDLDAGSAGAGHYPPEGATAAARFAVMRRKAQHAGAGAGPPDRPAPLAASARPEAIALPARAPFGHRSRSTRTAARCA